MALLGTPVAKLLIDMGFYELLFLCKETALYIPDIAALREKRIAAAAEAVWQVLKPPHVVENALYGIHKMKRAVLACGELESIFVLRQHAECWHRKNSKTLCADSREINDSLRAFVMFNVRYCFNKSKSIDYRVVVV